MPACLYVYHMCATCPQRPEEGSHLLKLGLKLCIITSSQLLGFWDVLFLCCLPLNLFWYKGWPKIHHLLPHIRDVYNHAQQDWSFLQYTPTNELYTTQKTGSKSHGTLKKCRWRAGHNIHNMVPCLSCPLQAVNPGRSLFLLYALKSSPRLGLLYLYLFDYTDCFLPFIHTICPLQENSSGEDIFTKLLVGKN